MQRQALRRLSLLLLVLLVAAPSVPRLVRAADAVEEDAEAEIDAFATEDEPVEEVDEKDVIVLTEKTFNETVLKAPFALVRPCHPSTCSGDDDGLHLHHAHSRLMTRAGRVLRSVVRTLPGTSDLLARALSGTCCSSGACRMRHSAPQQHPYCWSQRIVAAAGTEAGVREGCDAAQGRQWRHCPRKGQNVPFAVLQLLQNAITCEHVFAEACCTLRSEHAGARQSISRSVDSIRRWMPQRSQRSPVHTVFKGTPP